MDVFTHWTRKAATLAGTASVIALAVSAMPTTAGAADITNPAQHPYPITIKIDGQTYHDGEDTLPGYDDYACTPIPDVQYDFADNEILYYDDQGNLLATAPWTEWTRISSYKTWVAQQQTATTPASSGSGSSSSSSTSSGSGSASTGSGSSSSSGSAGSGGSSSGSSSAGSSAPTSSGSGSPSSGAASSGSGSAGAGASNSATPTATAVNRGTVESVTGTVAKAPTGKRGGRYKVRVLAGSGKATATGVVTIKVRNGKSTDAIAQKLSHGVATFSVPKLAAGTWNVAISWPGDTHYLGHVAVGAAIKVGK